MTQSKCISKFDDKKILNTVMNTSKAIIESIKFEMDYDKYVSKKQEKKQ